MNTTVSPITSATKITCTGLLTAYCSLIFWISHQPKLTPPGIDLFPHVDKIFHFGAYFVMGLLAWLAFSALTNATASQTGSSEHLIAVLAWLFCALYGASDEFHQSFVVGRDMSALDWLADAAGAASAVFLLEKKKAFLIPFARKVLKKASPL